MGKIVGYCRVSTAEQSLDLQIDALEAAGCARLYKDVVSGAKAKRPGLDSCLANLQPGDTLLVYRLDRLGRSMRHLVNLIEDLRERGVAFKSIQDGAIDTTTASGELIFNIFSSLAQFERRLIQERTMAGLKSARARGRSGGRPSLSSDAPKVQAAKEMSKNVNKPINDICTALGISRATYYRYVSL